PARALPGGTRLHQRAQGSAQARLDVSAPRRMPRGMERTLPRVAVAERREGVDLRRGGRRRRGGGRAGRGGRGGAGPVMTTPRTAFRMCHIQNGSGTGNVVILLRYSAVPPCS